MSSAHNLESVKPKQEVGENDSRFVRTDKRPHQCIICLKSFRSLSYLTEHLAIHKNTKPFVCGVCNKSFRFSTGLNTHKSVHDENNKIYKCVAGNCALSYRLRGNLKQHMKKEHYRGEGELDAIWNSHPALTPRKRGTPLGGIKREIKPELGCNTIVKKEIKSESGRYPIIKKESGSSGQIPAALIEDDAIADGFVPPPAKNRQYLDLDQVCQIMSPRLGQLLNFGNSSQVDQQCSVVAKEDPPHNPLFCAFCCETMDGKDVIVGHVWEHVSFIKKMCCYECALVNCGFKSNVRAEIIAHKSAAHHPEDGCKIVDHRRNLDEFFKNCLRKYFTSLDPDTVDELCAARYM